MLTQGQEIISQLFNSHINDDALVFEFNLFHRSVEQKLWSTEYYCTELVNFCKSGLYQFIVFPPESDTQSAGPTVTAQFPLLDMEGYCRNLNRLLDGFFMNSMSVLDTLAHEISILYCFPNKPDRIYIVGIKNMLANSYPSSSVGRLLDDKLRQCWFTEFEPFRHCTTHESLIGYDHIKISYDQVTNRFNILPIKLPDNPQARPFTYRRNRKATDFCESTFKKIQFLVTKVYESILKDVSRNNSTFPIRPV